MIFMAPATLLARLSGAIRKRLDVGLIRHPLGRASRPYLLQCLNRWMFWGMAGLTLALSLVPIQFEPGEYLAIRLVLSLSLGVLLGLQLVPPAGSASWAISLTRWGGFLGVEWLRVFSPFSASDGVVISPPFRGEWYVFQGGGVPWSTTTTRSGHGDMPSAW